MNRPSVTRPLLWAVFFASGLAGLGYQTVWAKMFAFGLGHDVPAVLAVVAAVMGGLAVGAWSLDTALARSARPLAWYAALEAVIGAWGLITIWLVPGVNRAAMALFGSDPAAQRHWAITFALPLLALLPATAAMGATLPAMERAVAPLMDDRKCVGALYALNTGGAVLGVLLAAFVLMPQWSFNTVLGFIATVNFLCALLALRAAPASPSVSPPASHSPLSLGRLYLTAFVTGLLGIGYEVVGVRLLGLVLENTVYTFAAVLAIYLVGTAFGAAAFQRWWRTRVSPLALTDLLLGTATAVTLGVLALSRARALNETLRGLLGETFPATVACEMILAALVFFVPSFAMGATFSFLAQNARTPRGGVGRTFAVNTAGGALAGAVFAVTLLPTLGAKTTLAGIAFGYIALVPTLGRRRWLVLSAPGLLVVAVPAGLHLIDIPPGYVLREQRAGVAATVTVLEDASGARILRVNNRFQMGSTATALAQQRQAHIPLLFHPAPRRALLLGVGTGITLAAVADHPGVEADGVELLPEVLAVLPQFAPINAAVLREPRLRLQVADARRFVRTARQHYDVIQADVFHPGVDGAGGLYSLEHFRAIRARLNPGGLCCQWLPLHQLDQASLRSIVHTFLQVFPETHACLLQWSVEVPVMGLIGHTTALGDPATWAARRLGESEFRERMKAVGLNDALKLFGTLVADAPSLAAYAAGAALNTDAHPIVMFQAPRRPPQAELGTQLLLEVIARTDLDVNQLFPGSRGAQVAPPPLLLHLRDYLAARDLYLDGLAREARGELAAAIDAYLEAAARSLYFTPAYARCVSIVSVLAKTDRAAARRLFERLEQAQPDQPLGRQMLAPLFDPAPNK